MRKASTVLPFLPPSLPPSLQLLGGEEVERSTVCLGLQQTCCVYCGDGREGGGVGGREGGKEVFEEAGDGGVGHVWGRD